MRAPLLLSLIAGLGLACTQAQPTGAPPTPAGDVAALKARWERLNGTCRGGSGDDPATMKACDERDAVLKQIEARGWCWGRDEQIQADKTWVQCAPKAR